jgi:hypothetical protein
MEREIELHCPECREQQWQMLSDIELDAGPFFRLVPAVAIATTNGSAT